MLLAARSNDQRQEIKAAYKKAFGQGEQITFLSSLRPGIISWVYIM